MPVRLRQFVWSAAIALILISTVTVFVPFAIYSGNPTEFSASFVELQVSYLPFVAAIVVFCGLLGFLATGDGFQRWQAVLAAVAVLLWVQGNLLVWDYGVLDGRSIDWTEGWGRGLLDTLMWASVFLLALTAYKRVGRLLVHMAIGVFAIQSFSALLAFSTSDDADLMRSSIEDDLAGKEEMYRFSKTNNVVHIILDGFQTDIFESLVDEKGFRQELVGFTLFRENLGAYPYTQMSIPAFLSGKFYRNEQPYADFIDETLTGDTVLNAAAEAGFAVDIAAPVALKHVYAKNRHANAYGIANSSHATANDYIKNNSAKLLDLSLFRVVPHFGKALVHRDELWVFQAMVRSESYLQMQYFADLAFLNELSERMQVDRDEPVYKIFHLMLSHRPTAGNENCEYEGTNPTNRKYVTMQSACSLKTVLAVLSRIKELGIYDSSTIVLMADHGAWVPDDNFSETNRSNAIDPMSMAMAMPLLAIKPAANSDSFKVSGALTSIIDVPATVASLLNFETAFPGSSVFELDAGQERTRNHYTYVFGANDDAEGYLHPMHEKIVTGSLFDWDSWQRGARYYPQEKRAPLAGTKD